MRFLYPKIPLTDLPAMTGYALIGAVLAGAYGVLHDQVTYSIGNLMAWENLGRSHGIVDLPAFVRVAYIHNSSYLGGLVGLIAAIVLLRNRRV